MTDKEKKELHTKTITEHIAVVRDLCNKMGIPELGKEHDLSKFSPEEFEIYKYADGKRSPHDNARDVLGYSPSWCLHKGRNLHHWEAWLDSHDATPNSDGTFTMIVKPVKMPYDRVIEMLCDFVGAGQVYSKEKWTKETPWDYWIKNCEGKRAMHPTSEYLLKKLLWNIHESGLENFISWYSRAKNYLEENYNKGLLDY